MAVPARRTSKTKKRMRRGHIKLNTPNVQFDATNGEYRVSHRVSPKGFYKANKLLHQKLTTNRHREFLNKKLFFLCSFLVLNTRWWYNEY